mgnify:CR=1 FL=1
MAGRARPGVVRESGAAIKWRPAKQVIVATENTPARVGRLGNEDALKGYYYRTHFRKKKKAKKSKILTVIIIRIVRPQPGPEKDFSEKRETCHFTLGAGRLAGCCADGYTAPNKTAACVL